MIKFCYHTFLVKNQVFLSFETNPISLKTLAPFDSISQCLHQVMEHTLIQSTIVQTHPLIYLQYLTLVQIILVFHFNLLYLIILQLISNLSLSLDSITFHFNSTYLKLYFLLLISLFVPIIPLNMYSF